MKHRKRPSGSPQIQHKPTRTAFIRLAGSAACGTGLPSLSHGTNHGTEYPCGEIGSFLMRAGIRIWRMLSLSSVISIVSEQPAERRLAVFAGGPLVAFLIARIEVAVDHALAQSVDRGCLINLGLQKMVDQRDLREIERR